MQFRRSTTLLAAIGAALAVASPAMADTDGTGVATTVPTTLTVTAPADVDLGTIHPGTLMTPIGDNVNVKANVAWGLTAYAAAPSLLKDGTGTALSNPLQVVLGSQNGDLDTVKPATDATSGTQTGDAGVDKAVTFAQAFSYSDAPGAYTTTVTFEVAAPIGV